MFIFCHTNIIAKQLLMFLYLPFSYCRISSPYDYYDDDHFSYFLLLLPIVFHITEFVNVIIDLVYYLSFLDSITDMIPPIIQTVCLEWKR